MTACEDDATHYVVIRTGSKNPTRVELCRAHLDLAHRLAESELTKIVSYGPLDQAWTVHPGGMK
jgi:hypothetical protein